MEKARLLHALFPNEIPAFLEYVRNISLSLNETDRAKIESPIGDTGLWLGIAGDTASRIERCGNRLQRKAPRFAHRLFDGQHALYMLYCLKLYVETRQHPNAAFVKAVELLFETDRIFNPKTEKR